ncbi:MAG: methyltransferase domain-containing protein, partial [Pseudomonadota bacterium]
MLQFDAETTRLLEIAYQGADVTRRRQASFDMIVPRPGEVILDIGCGTGLLTADLARAVGPGGKVIGVDPSADMRKPALLRCQDLAWVEIVDGTANKLPVKKHLADKAISSQVFEYLDDIEGAIREAHRTLKSGGRLVVGDMHFDSFIWFSDHPDRMQRMKESWDDHLAERCVPAILPGILRDG